MPGHSDTELTAKERVEDGELSDHGKTKKKKSQKQKKRSRKGESSDSDSSSSSSDSGSSDSGSDCGGEDKDSPVKIRKISNNLERFDPTKKEVEAAHLTEGMRDYVKKFFLQHLDSRDMREKVLDQYPVPEVLGLTAPEVDDELEVLARTPPSDADNQKIQARILAAMGPLTKLWLRLDTLKKNGGKEEVDLLEVLSEIETTIICIGQASQTVSYYRKLNLVSAILKDRRRAEKLLKKKKKVTSDSKRRLFGKGLARYIVKKTKKHRPFSFRKGASFNYNQNQSRASHVQFQPQPFRPRAAPFRSAVFNIKKGGPGPSGRSSGGAGTYSRGRGRGR